MTVVKHHIGQSIEQLDPKYLAQLQMYMEYLIFLQQKEAGA
jgi:hypothetical protein